jgi:hypothetical protein
MKTAISLKPRFPLLGAWQFRVHLVNVAVVFLALVFMPALRLLDQFSSDIPGPSTAPPLGDASVLTGILHFTRGARDWREAELKLPDGGTVLLQCYRYRASDACFTLQDGQNFEGASAKVWWHPQAHALQIQVLNETVVPYEDTMRRFAAPRETRGAPAFLLYFGVLLLLVVLAVSVLKCELVEAAAS